MIVKENITIYKCEFCNKKLYVKHAMLKHEDYVDNTKQVSVFKCSKLDKLMFPFSIERKKLHEKYDTYSEQEPMPNSCDNKEQRNDIY